jgi:hypothetical protein
VADLAEKKNRIAKSVQQADPAELFRWSPLARNATLCLKGAPIIRCRPRSFSVRSCLPFYVFLVQLEFFVPSMSPLSIAWESPFEMLVIAMSHVKEWISTHSFGYYALAILAVMWANHIISQFVNLCLPSVP